jgi:hypothetical protein
MITPHAIPESHRGDIDLDAGIAWLFEAWLRQEIASGEGTPAFRAWLARQAERLGDRRDRAPECRWRNVGPHPTRRDPAGPQA